MIIDTHHHFWNYNPAEYDWLDESMSKLRRNFLPVDLLQEIENAGVGGVISVQARQILEETDWLLRMADENDFIKGVVGWVPLCDSNIGEILEKYSANRWLKGVRHVVQGEPDPEFILGKDFNRGVSLLKNHGLVYEILVFEHQLPNVIKFVQAHPNQVFVLDHIAKPKIKTNEIEAWAGNINKLAEFENVSCKISGMVTEADFYNWTEEQLMPYFDVVLNAFGPGRLLFGSDWPVCLVATTYSVWLNLVKKIIEELSLSEQKQILSQNAIRIYEL